MPPISLSSRLNIHMFLSQYHTGGNGSSSKATPCTVLALLHLDLKVLLLMCYILFLGFDAHLR